MQIPRASGRGLGQTEDVSIKEGTPMPIRPATLAAALLLLWGTGSALAQTAAAPTAHARASATQRSSAEAQPAKPRRTPSEAQAAQQQRMRDCSAQARERTLSGDARSNARGARAGLKCSALSLLIGVRYKKVGLSSVGARCL